MGSCVSALTQGQVSTEGMGQKTNETRESLFSLGKNTFPGNVRNINFV